MLCLRLSKTFLELFDWNIGNVNSLTQHLSPGENKHGGGIDLWAIPQQIADTETFEQEEVSKLPRFDLLDITDR